MTTIAERMRAAAQWIDDSCGEQTEIGDELRADADAIEAVERELRAMLIVDKYADRLRGEVK